MLPRVVTYPVGELTWYLVSVVFASPLMARHAWEDVERHVPRGSLGIYRHGPDLPELRGCVVTVVSLDSGQAMRCARRLRGGSDYELDEQTTAALIARRARVVMQYAEQGEGRVAWRRPEGRGATMRPDGTMREPGGQG